MTTKVEAVHINDGRGSELGLKGEVELGVPVCEVYLEGTSIPDYFAAFRG